MIAGRVGALDIAKLTLETVVDHFVDIVHAQVFGIHVGILPFDAVIVDGVE